MDRRVKWLAAAAAVAMAAGPASAGTNHQWGDYHWANSDGKLTLTLQYKFRDPRWKPFHDASIAVWRDNSQSPLDLIDGGESNATSSKKCDPVAGRVIVCADNYGYRGWLGIASITATGTHINTATVKYNDSYYSSGRYDTPDERTFVTCHEVGHTFGLGHLDEAFDNPNKGSCMDYTSDPAGSTGELDNREPGQIDWDTLNSNTMYGHFDTDGGSGGGGDGGGGGGGPGGGPPEGKGPNKLDPFDFREVGQPLPPANPVVSDQWGRAVGVDAHGRPNVFELDVRPGVKKLTHVTWMPGFRPQRQHMRDD